MRVAISAESRAVCRVWCFLAAPRASVLVAAVPCCCSALLSLALSLYQVPCVVRVEVALVPLVLFLVLLPAFLAPMRFLRSLVSSFRVLSSSLCSSSTRMSSFCSSSFFLCFGCFSCRVFLEKCAKFLLLLLFLRMLLLLLVLCFFPHAPFFLDLLFL